MYGKDYGYANSRLSGSLVRSEDGEGVFVHEVRGDGECAVSRVSDMNKVEMVPIGSLNMVPVPLGYYNTPVGAHYVCRMPVRQDWRQGLRRQTLHHLGGHRPNLEELGDCIKGIYPTFDECVGLVGGRHSVAFHRKWCLRPNHKLEFRGFKVGVWAEDGTVTLSKAYTYLQEALDRAKNT